jgi:hypothetical protein
MCFINPEAGDARREKDFEVLQEKFFVRCHGRSARVRAAFKKILAGNIFPEVTSDLSVTGV